MTSHPTRSLTSIGHASCQLQVPVSAITSTMAQMAIQPAMVINGVLYLGDDDMARVAKAFQAPGRRFFRSPPARGGGDNYTTKRSKNANSDEKTNN